MLDSASDPAASHRIATSWSLGWLDTRDQNVFVSESREMVKLLRALHADVRYTEYGGVPHESWDQAYGEPELPAWLLSKHR
jgi:hypothetical protein